MKGAPFRLSKVAILIGLDVLAVDNPPLHLEIIRLMARRMELEEREREDRNARERSRVAHYKRVAANPFDPYGVRAGARRKP